MKKFAKEKGLIFILVMLIILVGVFSLKINKQYTNSLKTTLSKADVQAQNLEQIQKENTMPSTNTAIDENGEKLYDIQIELNKLGTAKNNNIAGALFKISNNNQDENVNLNIYNKKTGEKINANEEGNVQIPEEGAIIDASNIKKEHVYEIKIEEVQAPDGYKKTLENAIVEISVDENENIIGKVKSVNSQTAQDDGTISAEDSEGSKKGVIEFSNENEEGKSIIKKENTALGLQYKLGEDGTWTDYTGDLQINENTTIYARATDGSNYSGVSLKVINNIDKVPPTIVSIKEKENNDDIETSIDISITDDASGITGYGISKSNTEEPSYTKVNQELSVQATIGEISENGTYYLWVKDAATNVTKKEFEITGVKRIAVAKIISASEGNESLVNTEYYTLKEALEAIPDGATATIQIIHDIYDESNEITNKNITLDLNGFLVQTRNSEKPTISLKSGKLTVLNNKISGGLTSKNTQVVVIEPEGTLTLGKDDRRITIAQPALKGNDFGVKNNGGTFNFYDGSITAKSAIYGKVTETPAAYSVSVVDGQDTQTATLAIISDIEARIGRKTYTKLEDAITDAGTKYGTDGSQVEIVLVKDLAKSETVVVDSTKNIKIDLDGHVLTTTSTGYVIENYGQLEVVDESSYGGNYSYKIEAEKSNIVSGNKSWSNSSFSGGYGVDYAKDLNFDFEVTEPGTYVLTVAGSYFSRESDIFLDGSTESIYNFASDGNKDSYTIKDIVIENITAGKHNIRFYNSTDGYSPIYDYFKVSNNKGLGKITSTTNSVILNGSTDDVLGDAENIDLTNIKKFNEDDQYYFEYNPLKGLVNTNNTHADSLNTIATGYLPIDLSDREGKYTLTINAEISSYYNYGYVSLTNEPDNSSRVGETTYGRFIQMYGDTKSKDYSINLAGGQKYYLNFRYSKGNNNTTRYNDEFRINSIKLEQKNVGKLTLTSGMIELDKSGTSSSAHITCISNFGRFDMNGGIITSNKDYVAGAITQDGALTSINNGTIEMFNRSNGMGVWGLRTAGLTKVSGGNIRAYSGAYTNASSANMIITGGNFDSDCYYQIWNGGNYAKVLIENVKLPKKTFGSYNVYINAAYNKTIIDASEIEATGGSAIYNVFGKNCSGEIKINNTKITGSHAISNGYVSYGTYDSYIDIDNSEITTKYSAIYKSYDNSININIKNTKLIVTDNDSVIDLRTKNSNLSIVDSILENTNSSSNKESINITGGKVDISGNTVITTGGAAIYSSSTENTDINIKSGTLTSKVWQAIEMPNSKGTITLGEKGGNVLQTPVLKSSLEARTINAGQMKLNYYDGKLLGKHGAIIGTTVNELEDDYDVISNINNDGYEEITLGKPTEYVAQVENGEKYMNLQDAISACSTEAGDTKTTIKLLKDITVVKTLNIKEGQNIIIDSQENYVYACTSPGILNKGKIEFINTLQNNRYENTYDNFDNNGSYYFVNQDGKWASNNNGKSNTISNSYVRIDLSQIYGKFDLVVNAEISSEKNYDIGYATISENKNAPSYSNSSNRFIYISGDIEAKDYTTTLEGGKVYYLHLGYRKDGSSNVGNDCFTINNINIKGDITGKTQGYISYGNSLLDNYGITTIADKNVTFELCVSGMKDSYKSVIKNWGTMNVNSGRIRSSYSYINAIKNCDEGTVKIKEGEIVITGAYGYGIYNDSAETVEMTGGNITVGNSTVNSDMYGIYNNIGTVEITGGIITSEHGNSTNRSYGIYNVKGTVEATGGVINVYQHYYYWGTSPYADGMYNDSGNIQIKENTKINSQGYGIRNKTGEIEVNGATIVTTLRSGYGVYNEGNGTINIVDGTITTEGESGYGISNGSTGVIEITESTITTTGSYGYGIYNSNTGTVKISGGLITTSGENGKGIYNSNAGNIEITGGTVTTSGQNAYGVYNSDTGDIKITDGVINSKSSVGVSNNKGRVTIGEKITDEGIENKEVPNITSPKIMGATYGVYNVNGIFNYYDGAITGAIEKSIYLYVTEKEEGYEIVKNVDLDNEGNKLETETAILQKVSIAEITEDDNATNLGKYSSFAELKKAVNSLEDTEKTYKLKILSNFSVSAAESSLIIPENLNIIIDLNGNTIDSSNSSIIINKGKVTFIDSSDNQKGCIANGVNGDNKEYNCIIQNEGVMYVNSGTINATGNYVRNVYNEGKLQVNGGRLLSSGTNVQVVYNIGMVEINNVELTSTGAYGYGIYNDSAETVKMTGGNITVGNSTVNSDMYGIYNNIGTVEITGGIITSEHGNSTNRSYGIYNVKGTVEATGGVINVYQHYYYWGTSPYADGMYNDSGNIQIKENTKINSQGYGIRNKTGEIEVNGATIVTTLRSGYGVYNEGNGTINIVDGTITTEGESGYGIYNGSTGAINIKSGIIITSGAYGHGLCNNIGEIEMTGGTVTTSGQNACGVNNSNTGVISINGGVINSNASVGASNNGTGKIIVGERMTTEEIEENETPSKVFPQITGATYGITNFDGELCFYDGAITAPKEQSINKYITDIEDGYGVKKNKNYDADGNETGTETAILDAMNILEIEGKTTYKTISELQEGINSIEEGTVNILTDFYMCKDESIIIPEGKKIILNLNGHTITTTSKNTIVNNGNMEITDNSDNHNGYIRSRNLGTNGNFKYVILNTQTANLEIKSAKISANSNYEEVIFNLGYMKLNGGVLNTSGSYGYGVYNNGTGIVDVIDGEITTTYNYSHGIYNNSTEKIKLIGGTITTSGSYGYGIYNNNTGTVEIDKVDIIVSGSEGRGIHNANKAIINFKGGNITTTSNYGYGIYNSSGVINISGGDINVSHANYQNIYGVYNSSGIINISGGSINVNNSYRASDAYGVCNGSSSGTVNISGIASIISNGYGVYVSAGIVNIVDGKVTSTELNAVTNNSSGIITIGKDDESVIDTAPVISGLTYGVSNSGTFNFYDGIITGTTKAISGSVTKVPENYKVSLSPDETTATLDINATADSIASVGGIYYDTLQSAISAAAQSSEPVELHKDIELTSQVTIEQNKTVTINLNACSITYNGINSAILNNGTLTITDIILDEETEKSTSLVQNTSGPAITNNGTLTIGVDDGVVDTVTPNIVGTPDAIENMGTLNLYDGLINGEPVKVGTTTAEVKVFSLAKANVLKQNNNSTNTSTGETVNYMSVPKIAAKPTLPEWTNDHVDVTIENTNRLILNISNPEKGFDLALRKYISKVNDEAPEESRAPQITKYTEQGVLETNTGYYKHPKQAVFVNKDDIVVYNINIYNEGTISGYASEITDYLPDGLEFVQDNDINIANGWKIAATDDSGKITAVKTNALENKLIQANENSNTITNMLSGTLSNAPYVQLACKVTKQPSANKIYLTSRAELTAQKDENGNVYGEYFADQENKNTDIDSTPATIKDNLNLSTYYAENVENFIPKIENYYEGSQDDDDSETVYMEEKTDVQGTKTWENIKYDENNLTVTIELYKDGVATGKTVETTKAKNWKYSFENLSKYDNGRAIVYTVKETKVTNLSKDITNKFTVSYNGNNIKNTEKVDIAVTKKWNVDNPQNYKTVLTLKKTVNGITTNVSEEINGTTVNITKEIVGNGIATFENLEKYENGTKIQYSVEETEIKQTQDNGTTWKSIEKDKFIITNKDNIITNTLKTNVIVNKQWQGTEQAENYRATFNLYKVDGKDENDNNILKQVENTETKTVEGNGTVQYTDLPAYSGNEKITYKVVEESAECKSIDGLKWEKMTKGFDYKVNQTEDTITNIILEKKTATAQKVWADVPNSKLYKTSFGLYKIENNIEVPVQDENGNQLTKEIIGDGEVAFTNLAKYDSSDNEIQYTVKELENTAYCRTSETTEEWTKFTNYCMQTDDNGVTKNVITTDISKSKKWQDVPNVNLYKAKLGLYKVVNGSDVEVKDDSNNQLTKEVIGNNKVTFTNVVKYENGKEITYKVKEIEAYYRSSEEDNNWLTLSKNDYYSTNEQDTIINKIVKQVKVTKLWDNVGNANLYQANIVIKNVSNGSKVNAIDILGKTVNSQNIVGNNYITFSNLPKYNNGNEIKYEVEEQSIKQRKTTSSQFEEASLDDFDTNISNENNSNEFKIVNTKKKIETTEVYKNKVWRVAGNVNDYSATFKLYKRVNNQEIEVTKDVDENEITEKVVTGDGKVQFSNIARYDENKNEIEYVIKEVKIEKSGKQLDINNFIIQNNGDTIINTEKISVEGTKTWVVTKYKLQNLMINVRLYKNGKPTDQMQTITSRDEWKYSFNELPVADENGVIEYSVKEEKVLYNNDNQDTDITNNFAIEYDGYNIRNLENIEYVNYSVESEWQGVEEPTSFRVELTLYKTVDSKLTEVKDKNDNNITKVVTGNDNVSFENLPKYEDGAEVAYSVKVTKIETTTINGSWIKFESDTDKIETSISSNKVTNRLLTSITVQKEWQNNDKDVSNYKVNVALYRKLDSGLQIAKDKDGNNVNLKEIIGNSSVQFTNLPKYENGLKIIYVVKETSAKVQNENNWDEISSDLYVVKYGNADGTVDTTGNIKIVNSFEDTSYKVKIKWDDNNNQDGKRPTSLILQLKANNKNYGNPVTLSSGEDGIWQDNELQYMWSKLIKYENGKEIEYSVEEVEIPEGYVLTKEENAEKTELTIINKYSPQETQYEVEKVWDDSDNQDGIRPQTVKLQLKADGENYGNPVILTSGEDNQWQSAELQYVWNNLPKYNNGKLVTYSAEELEVPSGYTSSKEESAGKVIITNTHTPELTTHSVKKVWSDNNNQDGTRPQTVKMQLKANGEPVGAAVLMSAEEDGIWQEDELNFKWINLPKYKEGTQIAYSVKELELTEGYVSTKEEHNDTTIITNTYIPKQTNITVKKVWNDNNNENGKRPEKIEVQLKANEKVIGEKVTLSKDRNWEYTWQNLAKKNNGEDIKYTVEELSKIADYETEYSEEKNEQNTEENKNESVYVITNTYKNNQGDDKKDNDKKDDDNKGDKPSQDDKKDDSKNDNKQDDNENKDNQDNKEEQKRQFDLSLRKWVTEAIITTDNETKVIKTGNKAEDNPKKLVKVDIKGSQVNNVIVRFKYSIKVTNEGQIPGTVEEITDYIPNGLKFEQQYNKDWTYTNGNATTNILQGKILQPGETAEVEIILTWENNKNNLGLKTNIAEITKDYNTYGIADKDSTPANNNLEEDDIDTAGIILTTKTGSTTAAYITLSLSGLALITFGIIAIKRKVLKI